MCEISKTNNTIDRMYTSRFFFLAHFSSQITSNRRTEAEVYAHQRRALFSVFDKCTFALGSSDRLTGSTRTMTDRLRFISSLAFSPARRGRSRVDRVLAEKFPCPLRVFLAHPPTCTCARTKTCASIHTRHRVKQCTILLDGNGSRSCPVNPTHRGVTAMAVRRIDTVLSQRESRNETVCRR